MIFCSVISFFSVFNRCLSWNRVFVLTIVFFSSSLSITVWRNCALKIDMRAKVISHYLSIVRVLDTNLFDLDINPRLSSLNKVKRHTHHSIKHFPLYTHLLLLLLLISIESNQNTTYDDEMRIWKEPTRSESKP